MYDYDVAKAKQYRSARGDLLDAIDLFNTVNKALEKHLSVDENFKKRNSQNEKLARQKLKKLISNVKIELTDEDAIKFSSGNGEEIEYRFGRELIEAHLFWKMFSNCRDNILRETETLDYSKQFEITFQRLKNAMIEFAAI